MDDLQDTFAFKKKMDDGKTQEEEVDGPAANSTPFLKRLSKSNGVRGSISDEIKVLGVKEMTPFCEKSAFHNESSGAVIQTVVETVESYTQAALFNNGFNEKNLVKSHDHNIINIVILLILSIVISFVFFGAIELEGGRMLLPIIWKLFGSNWIPEQPYVFLSISQDNPPAVW